MLRKWELFGQTQHQRLSTLVNAPAGPLNRFALGKGLTMA